MNKLFEQAEHCMRESLRKELPGLKPEDLEKDGAVFYMNGKNGTAFDWYVNEHFPNFFIFYNDKENLGAVKAALHTDGGPTAEELLYLAVNLTGNADDRRVWDADIRILEADDKPEKAAVERFLSLKEAYQPMIERRKLLSKTVIVSRKVREGGWKIGYGMRDEPTRESDSGWYFCVGDESDEFVNDPKNLELWAVNSALMYDPALNEFITAPYGTAIVRTASDRFEPDAPGKKIFIEKNK